MSTINFKENLKRFRKESALSQDELADKLGITSQAVSKWECGLSYPDMDFLIPLANLFGVTIDALLRGECGTDCVISSCNDAHDIPDDGKLRVVQFLGKKILRLDDCDSEIRIPLLIEQCDNDEKTVNVELWGSADIEGGINGSVKAGSYVNCGDGINGSVNAEGNVSCGDGINGSVNAGGYVNCGDGINGSVNAGGNVDCGDGICGNLNAAGHVECAGDIEGDVKAIGNVKCDGDIGGNAEAKDGSIYCGGDIGGAVTCSIVNGDINAGGDVICDEARGSINAEGNVYLGRRG